MSRLHLCSITTVLVIILLMSAIPSLAQVLEAPIVSLTSAGMGKQPVVVTAGRTGAPAGFTIWWMTEEDFIANGSQWYEAGDPRQESVHFWGTPTLNVFDGESPSFVLSPLTLITIELGDVADESGLSTSSAEELVPATSYVLCVFANGLEGLEESPKSENYVFATRPQHDCLFTQGFWKNHELEWPVESLILGTGRYVYPKEKLLSILEQPVQGNGLISLAHQLIATKLNIALGADAAEIIGTVMYADEVIGELVVPPEGYSYIHPSVTSALTQALDDYNNDRVGTVECGTDWCCVEEEYCFPTPSQTCLDMGGIVIGPEGCSEEYSCTFPVPVEWRTWGTLKTQYR